MLNPKYCVVNDKCEAKATSVYACGKCGAACGPGEKCSGGKCSCGTLTGKVGGGPACGKGKYCVQGKCTNLPPGTLLAPFSLDFEKTNGGLKGTKDWEWGKVGTWKPSKNCDSTSSTIMPKNTAAARNSLVLLLRAMMGGICCCPNLEYT